MVEKYAHFEIWNKKNFSLFSLMFEAMDMPLNIKIRSHSSTLKFTPIHMGHPVVIILA